MTATRDSIDPTCISAPSTSGLYDLHITLERKDGKLICGGEVVSTIVDLVHDGLCELRDLMPRMEYHPSLVLRILFDPDTEGSVVVPPVALVREVVDRLTGPNGSYVITGARYES